MTHPGAHVKALRDGWDAAVSSYVATAPGSAHGVYETWAECMAKVNGVPGARFQSVDSREKAEALLGDGIILPPGTYAFTDGNAEGGVGVVVLGPAGRVELAEVAAVVV